MLIFRTFYFRSLVVKFPFLPLESPFAIYRPIIYTESTWNYPFTRHSFFCEGEISTVLPDNPDTCPPVQTRWRVYRNYRTFFARHSICEGGFTRPDSTRTFLIIQPHPSYFSSKAALLDPSFCEGELHLPDDITASTQKVSLPWFRKAFCFLLLSISY